MSQAPELPVNDSPQFEPSPSPDQPDQIPPAASPPPARPVETPVAARPAATSLISNALLMIVGAAIAAGAYALARGYAPPQPPGETAGSIPSADMVKPDDFKKLTDRVDKMAAATDPNQKQVADRPDLTAQVKSLNDRLNDVIQTVSQLPAQFDSINQKLTTVSKIEDSNPAPKVIGITKQVEVDELNRGLDALRAEVAAIQRSSQGSTGSAKPDNPIGDAPALEQAISLYKAKKYPEARGAFMKLQETAPNDARVWYFSALSNGFASNEWRGDTERMVNTGLDNEKAGQPQSAVIDSAVASLTTATGKDWLAGYRKRIGAR